MKRFLQFLVDFIYKIYPYSLSVRIRSYYNFIYTVWLRNSLGAVGGHTIIESPCQLNGGGNLDVRIGSHSCIQSHVVLGCYKQHGENKFSPSITIGDHCSLGEYSHISAINKITIGNGCLTGRFVTIVDNSHGGLSKDEAEINPGNRTLKSKGDIKIGNNVWIGDKVTILGGITIGNNVIIAANAVVNKSIPDNCIVAGVPAKVIKHLE